MSGLLHEKPEQVVHVGTADYDKILRSGWDNYRATPYLNVSALRYYNNSTQPCNNFACYQIKSNQERVEAESGQKKPFGFVLNVFK